MATAVIRLHEDADRVATKFGGELSARGSVPPLEAVTDHSSAATLAATRHLCTRWERGGGIECGARMLCRDMESVDVVEDAIPRFPNYRETPRRRPWNVVQRPANHLVMHYTNGVCIRDTDRRGQEARFANPLKASHLAVPIETVCPCKERVRRFLY